jgi:hypothetical protein
VLGLTPDAVTLVINLFDNSDAWTTKQDFQRFVEQARDERQTTRAIEDLLASIPSVKLTAEPRMEVCCA